MTNNLEAQLAQQEDRIRELEESLRWAISVVEAQNPRYKASNTDRSKPDYPYAYASEDAYKKAIAVLNGGGNNADQQ